MIYEGTWFIQNLNFCQKAEKSLNLIICHGWVLSKVLSRLISVCQKVLYNFATECNFQYCIEKPAPSPLLQFTAHQLSLLGVLNLATKVYGISKFEKCSYCIPMLPSVKVSTSVTSDNYRAPYKPSQRAQQALAAAFMQMI